jgi:hypothetical protein
VRYTPHDLEASDQAELVVESSIGQWRF